MVEIITDIRNPCNCGSAQVPRQYQNEGTGDDHIECRDCGDEVTTLGYDECIAAWNAANTDYTWDDIIANGGPIEPLPGAFIFNIDTANTSTGSSNSDQFKLPTISAGTYDCNIDWGDGTDDDITAYDDAALTHTYADGGGSKTITITGQFEGWRFGNSGDRLKLLSIDQFGGGFRLGNVGNYFHGCANLESMADDLNTAGTTSFISMCNGCSSLLIFPDIDMSNATNISNICTGCVAMIEFRPTSFPVADRADSAWNGCSSIPAFAAMYFPVATSLNSAWFGCTLLASMGLVQMPMNENIQNGWRACPALKSLAVGQGLEMGAVTAASTMLFFSTLDTEPYSRLLEEIESVNQNNSVTFHGGNSKYNATNGATARAALIADHSWTITDGGAA